MNNLAIKAKAASLFREASFIAEIKDADEYAQALALMDHLIDDYYSNLPLINILSVAIDGWESNSPEFEAFNTALKNTPNGTATLRVLMEQHQLKATDLRDTIGSPSLVSMILNGSRKLTKDHIQALTHKFNLSPTMFFD